jgi:hypothetical protein
MKTLPFLLPLLFFNLLQAQKTITKESIINNKDISWVAEYEATFPFDLDFSKSNDTVYRNYYNAHNRNLWLSSLVIFRNPNAILDNMGLSAFASYTLKEMDIYENFAFELCKSIKSNKSVVYQDADLSKKLTPEEQKNFGTRKDSLYVIDPMTLEEILTVVTNELGADHVKSEVKAKFLLYYDSKNSSFHSVCYAIAPMIDIYDNQGYIINTGPVVWFPVYHQDKSVDYKSPNINYAKNTLFTFDISKAKVLKSIETHESALSKYYSSVRKESKKHNIFSLPIGIQDGDQHELTVAEKEKYGVTIDSIYIVDPETYEEVLTAFTREVKAEDCKDLRFEINFYWDPKEQKLKATTLSFSPIISMFDNDGNFITRMPFFYKKCCKGKLRIPKYD